MKKYFTIFLSAAFILLFAGTAEAKWPADHCYDFSKGKIKRKVKRVLFHSFLNKKMELPALKRKGFVTSAGGSGSVKGSKPDKSKNFNIRVNQEIEIDRSRNQVPDVIPVNQVNPDIEINVNPSINDNNNNFDNNTDDVDPPAQQQIDQQQNYQRNINNPPVRQQMRPR